MVKSGGNDSQVNEHARSSFPEWSAQSASAVLQTIIRELGPGKSFAKWKFLFKLGIMFYVSDIITSMINKSKNGWFNIFQKQYILCRPVQGLYWCTVFSYCKNKKFCWTSLALVWIGIPSIDSWSSKYLSTTSFFILQTLPKGSSTQRGFLPNKVERTGIAEFGSHYELLSGTVTPTNEFQLPVPHFPSDNGVFS